MKSDQKSTDKVQKRHIGVDVSKAKLDIYVPPAGWETRAEVIEVGNDTEGFRRLRELARSANATVCVEPTGGYEKALVASMLKFGVPVAYADALRVREFAKADGKRSKNDKIDAELIACFADKIGVREIEAPDAVTLELRRRVKLRQKLIDSRTDFICHLETETDPEMKQMLKSHIHQLKKLIAKIERMCEESVAKDPEKKATKERFALVGGVGDITATTILAALPEIGKLSDEKLNRLAGIAPEEKQSGTREWRRKIWGGRKEVRNALYMASIAALMWNSRLRDYYRKKRNEGHPHKWAIVPVMRKLLSLLNRIASDPNFTPAPEPESTKKNARAGRKRKGA